MKKIKWADFHEKSLLLINSEVCCMWAVIIHASGFITFLIQDMGINHDVSTT